ncbi:MAG TPA: hypothetical protein VG389_27315 [Myxococcota bacterium]|jgi:predicted PhzF superfamily epimerase YddE/YHI9|nr:hypothetical protein [Myxococcota bacterium]
MTKLAYWICDVFTERPLAPRLLHARVPGSAAQVERVEVGGHVVLVAHGEFQLP